MDRVLNYWRGVPAGARIAIVTLVFGWLLHYAIYFYNFSDDATDRTVHLQLLVGLGICYGVASGRPWARMLCIFFNIGIVALYALFSLALIQSRELGWFGLTAVTTATFVVSTWFLLRSDTRRFFSPPKPSAEDG